MPTETRLPPHTKNTTPRSRALLAMALATTLAAGTGCSSWRPLTADSPNGVVEDRPIRFHVGEKAYEVKGEAKHGPLILADAEVPGQEPAPVVVDLRIVEGAEVYAPMRGRNALIAVGTTVGGAGLIALAAVVAVASMQSSMGSLGAMR